MVALPDGPVHQEEQDMSDALRDAGVPGEDPDHRWLSRRLLGMVGNLAPEEREPDMPGLLATGLVRAMGLDPGNSARLAAKHWPEEWVRAVPPLLRCSFPPLTWGLVRRGLLSCEGTTWGQIPRWRLRLDLLAPLLNEWHELGECLVFRRIAEGLRPLSRAREGRIQVRLSGSNPALLRRCRCAFRAYFAEMDEPLPHFILSHAGKPLGTGRSKPALTGRRPTGQDAG